ncbi:hypothetical protein J6590_047123 [Homalodisca vitripennis]|nr:hypothetical protein J6590_047123 [Homalodisca vitripennis]
MSYRALSMGAPGPSVDGVAERGSLSQGPDLIRSTGCVLMCAKHNKNIFAESGTGPSVLVERAPIRAVAARRRPHVRLLRAHLPSLSPGPYLSQTWRRAATVGPAGALSVWAGPVKCLSRSRSSPSQ